jgi:hypothetical protein
MIESKSDNELIRAIKEGVNVSESFQELSKRHSAIFYKMASKYISRKFKESRIDFFSEKDYWIHKCILSYNEDKSAKFSTYLANMIKWICMNNYNKNLKNENLQFCDNYIKQADLETPEITSAHTIRNDFNEVMSFVKTVNDPRVYEIFKLRYAKGKKNNLMPWKDVCKNDKINLSVQGCINLHNKFLEKLKHKYKN